MSDDFDFDGTQTPSRGSSTMQLWDMLSILVLLMTACIAGYFLWIFINPHSPYNILPPADPTVSLPCRSPLFSSSPPGRPVRLWII